MPITRRTAAASLAAPLLLPAPRARAQPGYPNRQITWIVASAAGGIADAESRLIARKLGGRLRGTIVVENRPGAGGTIGVEHASRTAPDGLTLMYGSNGPMAAAPTLFNRLGYDPLRSFVAVHSLFESCNILLTRPGRPYRTLAELVAYAKANPGRVNLAHPGIGASGHLVALLLEHLAGIEFTHVAYPGAAAALTDLVAGNVDLVFDYVISTRDHIARGQLTPLVVTAAERIHAVPQVPTVTEEGYPDLISLAWSGLFVPAGTPEGIVDRLETETAAVVADPEVIHFGERNGSRVGVHKGRAAFRAFVEAENVRWGSVIRRANIPRM